MLTKKLFEEFAAEHGEHIQHGSWLLFADGARLSPSSLQVYDAPIPGSTDHYQAVRLYLQARLKAAQAEFDQMRRNMQEVASQCAAEGWDLPHDFDEAREHLAAIKQVVDERQSELLRHTEPEREVKAQLEVQKDEDEILRDRKRAAAREALEAISRL